ncbi:hypothetical protein [Saccharothrix sp. NRRL B-16348]|uniref:hypothetical protein n=1 Tax=Saccharothrix sp. NRRL B-16348 TaxID=1415542 RepID=UPI0012FB739E|nr:hypothetical protein [Saccharothrix sp. NRRL B-16348]
MAKLLVSGSSEVVMVVVWSDLASDLGGVVLFLVWLVIPLLYLVAVGRRYVRQCQENAQAAVWARDEVCLIREEQREGSHDGDAGE